MKKFIRTIGLILAIAMIFSTMACAGSATTNGWFYKPAYGEKGTTGYNAFNAALDASDTKLQAMYSAMNDAWVDYSATSTVVGWVSFTEKIIRYKKNGTTIFVAFSLEGTSNSTTTTFTLPYSTVSPTIYALTGFTVSGGVPQTTPGLFYFASSDPNKVHLYKDITGNGYSGSGIKGVHGQFFYETAP